jgi:hypothetical protein
VATDGAAIVCGADGFIDIITAQFDVGSLDAYFQDLFFQPIHFHNSLR